MTARASHETKKQSISVAMQTSIPTVRTVRNNWRAWVEPVMGRGAWFALIEAGLLGCGCRQHQETAKPGSGVTHDLPKTPAALNAWYVEPPAGQNAAVFHVKGFDALQMGKVEGSSLPFLGKGTLPPLGAPLPGASKSALAAVVQSNRDALHLFAQGA